MVKVGDEVICVNSERSMALVEVFLTAGNRYIVLDVRDDPSGDLKVVDDRGLHVWYLRRRFTLPVKVELEVLY